MEQAEKKPKRQARKKAKTKPVTKAQHSSALKRELRQREHVNYDVRLTVERLVKEHTELKKAVSAVLAGEFLIHTYRAECECSGVSHFKRRPRDVIHDAPPEGMIAKCPAC